MTVGTVPGWLSAVVSGQPRRLAIIDGDERWEYSDLWDRARRVARGLLERSEFEPGRRVGIVGENTAEYLAGYFGVLCAGGIVVPLNERLLPEELDAQLDFVEAAGCIVGHVPRDVASELARRPIWKVPTLLDSPARPLPSNRPDADATVLLTSGTTGAPKGVVHTHGTLLHAALQMALVLPFARDDVSIAFLPFFASIPEQVLPVLLSGAALHLLRRFEPEAVCRACEQATTFDSVPTIVARLLEHGDYEALNRLRWIAFASEPMPPAVLERWWQRVPEVRTHEFYGMTEMLTISHAGPEDLRADPQTVGSPFPTSSVAIVDERSNAVENGAEGEITCRSPARMRGYLGDADATAAAVTEAGAIRTGDVGRLDETGRLKLTGRLKDLIISGGMNIAPAEIEAAACRHPQVAAAAAIGLPDARWGETPVIVAVPRHGNSLSPSELLAHCRAELTGYKRPSAAAVIERLPVTGIGKSAKSEIKHAIVEGELEIVRAG